jgi:hypothetical protein
MGALYGLWQRADLLGGTPSSILRAIDRAGSDSRTMHRLTARLLLIFALAGNLVPLALAAATPAHACCLRKVANHCHTPAAQLDQPSIRAKGCCNHDCCRAATTARSACPSPLVHGPLDINVAVRAIASWLDSPRIEGTEFRPSRAPPAL